MKDEIINRVSKSNLITINLEDFYLDGKRQRIDISQWLYKGLILREKEFRQAIDKLDFSLFKDNYIALYCSSEAIIPSWAYLLIATKLAPFSKKIVVGGLEQLEISIFQEVIDALDITKFKDKPVILKGCSTKLIPETVYIMLVERLIPVVSSLMYGEACSTVPLFKRKGN